MRFGSLELLSMLRPLEEEEEEEMEDGEEDMAAQSSLLPEKMCTVLVTLRSGVEPKRSGLLWRLPKRRWWTATVQVKASFMNSASALCLLSCIEFERIDRRHAVI